MTFALELERYREYGLEEAYIRLFYPGGAAAGD